MLLPKTTNQHNITLTSLSILLFVSICLGVSLFVITPIQAYEDAQANQANQGNISSFELAQQTKEILTKNCFSCHGLNGVAVKNIFVLNYARLISNKTVIPSDSNSLLLRMVENNAMPLGKLPLSDKDKAILRNWVLAGAPTWEQLQVSQSTEETSVKKFTPESTSLAVIEQDLEKSSERSRPYLRYFSIAHLKNANASENELEEYRLGLAKLINSLSWHREISVPKPINQDKTLLRIDLRDFNWTVDTWRTILSVYPYAVQVPANEVIKNLSGAEIPYIRADWFVATASVPPLYHNILNLPNTITELERVLGVDVARNLREERNMVRAGMRNSGVSQNNRIVERHSSAHGAYWRSYDFKSSLDGQNIFSAPLTLTSSGGEAIFNLPNGMQAYFLADNHGKRLDIAPIEIVSDRTSPEDPVIRNGRSCMSCHFAGMKYFRDDMRPTLEAELNSASRNNNRYFLVEKALAIYPTQDQMDKLLEQDQERFRQAIEKTGSKLSGNTQNEPINALARRFEGELSLPLAAAEATLTLDEFQARLRTSSRLSALGYSQLLVANGGFKRDGWEKYFGDLVQELNLGRYIPCQTLNTNLRIASTSQTPISTLSSSNSANLTNAIEPNRISRVNTQAPIALGYDQIANSNSPAALLSVSQTMAVYSKTRFFNIDFFQTDLLNNKEFQAQGLSLTDNWSTTDLQLVIDRPVFTFDYTFNLKHAKKGIVIVSGKINAGDGRSASPKIAKELVKKLQELRKAAQ
jgi:mono/diheme cytochrome c family protein